MNRSFHFRPCLLLVLLLLTAITIAKGNRPLMNAAQGKDAVMASDISRAVSSANEEDEPCQPTAAGEEYGKGGQGEPSQERMLADAHLDYIYTESHKP